MFSVVLRPTDREVVPLLSGVAAAVAVRMHVPRAGLKWPNDLVIVDDDGIHKLGGLVASVHPGDNSAVVVGIGINFLFSGDRPTAEAAALGDFLSQLPTREQLLIEILVEMSRMVTMSRADIEAEYRELCLTIGQRVLVSTVDGQQVAGLARTASTSGITVELETGELKVFGSADIVHLRNS
jgi:BirA family biotin operon repressor/biotin-[acetyl-CoA-carboxylase] ligase